MKYAIPRPSVLADVLQGAGIKLVDIGGRGAALARVKPLSPFADYYVSEPDQAEAERLQDEIPRRAPWRSVRVITDAIAPHRGAAPLFVTREPGMSSLLEPDLAVAGRFYLGYKFEVAAVATVSTVPLDEAAAEHGFGDACFLKVDTQGTELDIIRSGAKLLDSVLAIHTEAEFHPFYQGQALFADLDSHLREQGFSLFSLSRANLRRAGHRPTLFSKRVVTWAHCVYFREPRTLMSRGSHARDLPRQLGLALALQYYDLAFELVGLAREVDLLAVAELDALAADVEAYVTFCTHQIVRDEDAASIEALLAPSAKDKKQLE